MKKLNMLLTCRQARRLLREHGPLVGIVTAGVGFTGSIISTVRATVKAVRHTDKVEEELDRTLTSTELVAENWKYYVSPALLWVGSVASLCFAAKSHNKSIKSLAALYAASETARKNLENGIVEKYGEGRYNEVQEEVAQKTLDQNPVTDATILETGHGSFLCYDPLSGRYFRSCVDHIKRCVNEFNNRICTQKYGMSYNELFDTISPKFDSIIFGNDVGWGPEGGVADIRYTTKKASNDEPCLVMHYNTMPYPDFDR